MIRLRNLNRYFTVLIAEGPIPHFEKYQSYLLFCLNLPEIELHIINKKVSIVRFMLRVLI